MDRREYRFPPEVIQHAIRLYHCFSLSLRDVELILAARGIVVSCENIREWGLRFDRMFANMLKRRRPQPGDKWYMDEVLIRIRGKQRYLLARGRPGWKCPRHPGPEPAQRHSGQAVFPRRWRGLQRLVG